MRQLSSGLTVVMGVCEALSIYGKWFYSRWNISLNDLNLEKIALLYTNGIGENNTGLLKPCSGKNYTSKRLDIWHVDAIQPPPSAVRILCLYDNSFAV